MSRCTHYGSPAESHRLKAHSTSLDNVNNHVHEFIPGGSWRGGCSTAPVTQRSTTNTTKAEASPTRPPQADAADPGGIPTAATVYVHGAGSGDQYKVCDTTINITNPPFDKIRDMCDRDVENSCIDTNPQAFSQHRRREWPSFVMGEDGNEEIKGLKKIYDVVRESGLPNCMSARIPLPSGLNIERWVHYANRESDEAQLVDFLRYGFPLGYMGPPSDTTDIPNHSSANDYPSQVGSFISTERQHGALVGPFLAVPFTPWAHISPLMSRPKSDSSKRRIISDLTFPREQSVNAYIQKNNTLGEVRDHTLPTVAEFVEDLKQVGVGAFMFTMDVARAYKNFRVDPLDWPLMCIRWDQKVYVETAMPFGARSSSCNMQRVANFIVRVLNDEGIRAKMYLDDLIVIAESEATAWRHYERVRVLFTELGLPEAAEKAQPPATRVRWLGIDICSNSMSLSIPESKLRDVITEIQRCREKNNIHRKLYESLLGRLLHVAKCVVPARIFMSRMLQAYREAKSWFIKVTPEVRADLDWFLEFCCQWNGRALIPPAEPDLRIQVDACLSGIGGSDGVRAYSSHVDPMLEHVYNITELEAINVVVAVHSFLTEADRGRHVLVECDNLAAVQALKWGRARNPVLAECSRLAWMVQAVLDITLTFAHIAGVENGVADVLSRAHLSSKDYYRAEKEVRSRALEIFDPCLHIFSVIHSNSSDRSGIQLAGGSSGGTAGRLAGAGDQKEPRSGGKTAGGIRHEVRDRPSQDVMRGRMPMDGILGGNGRGPRHGKESAITRARARAAGWRHAGGTSTPPGGPGGGRDDEAQGRPVGGEGCGAPGTVQKGALPACTYTRTTGHQSSVHNYVYGSDETVRGRPPVKQQVRSITTSDEGRRDGVGQSDHQAKVGQELAKLQPEQGYFSASHGSGRDVPGGGGRSSNGDPPLFSERLTAVTVPKDGKTGICPIPKGGVGVGSGQGRSGPRHIQPTQYQEGGGHTGFRPRLLRAGGPASRGLVLHGIQEVHRHCKIHESASSTSRDVE